MSNKINKKNILVSLYLEEKKEVELINKSKKRIKNAIIELKKTILSSRLIKQKDLEIKNSDNAIEKVCIELLENFAKAENKEANFKNTKLKNINRQLQINRAIAHLLISEEGKLNKNLLIYVSKLIKKDEIVFNSQAHKEYVFNILGILKNKQSLLTQVFESITLPQAQNERSEDIIRGCLFLEGDAKITLAHAKKAALFALLSDLRQREQGSCFATSIGILIKEAYPELFLDNIKNIIEKGYFSSNLNDTIFFPGETVVDKSLEKTYSISISKPLTVIPEHLEKVFLSIGINDKKEQKKLLKEALNLIYEKKNEANNEFFETKEYEVDSEKMCSTSFKEIIKQIVRLKLGIKEKDLKMRKDLICISQKINFIRQNNDNNVQEKTNQLTNKYNKINQTLSDSDDLFKEYDNLYAKARRAYTSQSKNLLLRIWENALAKPGRMLPGKNKLDKDLCNVIYYSPLSKKEKKLNLLGVKEKLQELIKENQLNQAVQKKIEQAFLKILTKRSGSIYDKGSFYLIDKKRYEQADQFEPLKSPKQWQLFIADCMRKAITNCTQEAIFKAINSNSQDDKVIVEKLIKTEREINEYILSKKFKELIIRLILTEIDQKYIFEGKEIPSKDTLKAQIKEARDGGFPNYILSNYFSDNITYKTLSNDSLKLNILKLYFKKLTSININKISNEFEFSIKLINKMRKFQAISDVDITKKPYSILARTERHAFRLLPSNESFKNAINSNLSAKKWIETEVLEKNGHLVLGDTNYYDLSGSHMYYVLAKNKRNNELAIYMANENQIKNHDFSDCKKAFEKTSAYNFEAAWEINALAENLRKDLAARFKNQ